MHETKIAIVLLDDLKTWQKLNVTAFLASAIAIEFPQLHGAKLVTADEHAFLPFLKQPMLIYRADASDQLQRAFNRARERDLAIGIYTRPLFDTATESDNLLEIANSNVDQQDLVGIVVYGDSKKVGKALDGLKLHE